jgi:hypothetical protein
MAPQYSANFHVMMLRPIEDTALWVLPMCPHSGRHICSTALRMVPVEEQPPQQPPLTHPPLESPSEEPKRLRKLLYTKGQQLASIKLKDYLVVSARYLVDYHAFMARFGY